jgi:uncharacterized protein YegP (UPF0339 family)
VKEPNHRFKEALVPAKFVLSKVRGGKFKFDLLATNGKVIASSASYDTKRAAAAGIRSVQKNGSTAVVDDQTAPAAKAAPAKTAAKKTAASRTAKRTSTRTTAKKATARKATASKATTAKKATPAAKKATARTSVARKTTARKRVIRTAATS